MAQLEDVCPAYVGASNIVLALKKPLAVVLAHRPTLITVELQDEALVSGLVLPLELQIIAPSPANFRRHFYTRSVPQQFAFTPREGGRHLLQLREVAHNRWCGSILVVAVGAQLDL